MKGMLGEGGALPKLLHPQEFGGSCTPQTAPAGGFEAQAIRSKQRGGETEAPLDSPIRAISTYAKRQLPGFSQAGTHHVTWKQQL